MKFEFVYRTFDSICKSIFYISHCTTSWVYIFQIKEHAINGKKQHFPNIFLLPPTSYIMEERPPTMGKQLVNFITCSCESSAPFCKLQSQARTHAVLVIGLYELLDPATELIEPPGPLLVTYVGGNYMDIW